MNPNEGANRTLALLGNVPMDSELALLLRHGQRGHVEADDHGNDVALTCRGTASARRLGAGLASFPLVAMKTSPLARCVQTAEALIAGAGWKAAPVPDPRLGGPGAFVSEPGLAGLAFLDLGPRGVVQRQLTSVEPPPGMRPAHDGVALLLDLITPAKGATRGISVFVTHDVVLATLVGSLYGLNADGFSWPGYLDALILWRHSNRLHFRWPGLGEGLHPIGR